jgi:hypothetical protein
MGYVDKYTDNLFLHYSNWDLIDLDKLYPLTKIIVIKYDNNIVGTLSLTIDDETKKTPHYLVFGDIINKIKKENNLPINSYASVWRLIVNNKNAGDNRIVGSLFDYAANYLINNNIRYIFCDVNPKHVKFYVKIFKMDVISDERQEITLSKTPPSILLSWDTTNYNIWNKNKKRLGI